MTQAANVQPDALPQDAFLLGLIANLLEVKAGSARGAEATHLLELLQACARDVTAIRDVDVWLMREKQLMSGPAIAEAFGVNHSRGAQLIKRATEVHLAADTRVAQLRRQIKKQSKAG